MPFVIRTFHTDITCFRRFEHFYRRRYRLRVPAFGSPVSFGIVQILLPNYSPPPAARRISH